MRKDIFIDKFKNLQLEQAELDRKWRVFQQEVHLNDLYSGSRKEKTLKFKFKDTDLFKTSEVGQDTVYNLVSNSTSFTSTGLPLLNSSIF